eukprot:TRINITY_DN46350_c0_g1_i1.p1 TRINITY_DN46350_c0_g1~~TRINITY_DN46350_c0_g1_i1.p1  ORF type:complete len:381 (-),score=79.00 TRINITY_DN46350_c0_g1_i1:195-1337(-)
MPKALTRPMRVGTDCSGMEAPIQALRNLGIQHEHIFSCDIDKHAEATIQANYPPKIWFPDLTKRDNETAPKVDLYVAGFPCQPFSACGKREGFKDKKGRGTILFDICDYLEEQLPRVFVLENVGNILRVDEGRTWTKILATLEGIGKCAYEVSWEKLNTKEHGVPQNRSRLYIVGVLKKFSTGTFSFSEIEKLPCPSIEHFLEPRKGRPAQTDLPPKSQGHAHNNVKRVLKELRAAGHDPLREPFVIDLDSTEKFCTVVKDCSQCITRRRGGGHWVTNRGRRTTKVEMMRLQGMEPAGFKQVVSDAQWGNLIGNSMSVNVLERIFVRLLPAANLVPAGTRLVDRWQQASKKGGGAPAPPKRGIKRAAEGGAPASKARRTA